MKTRLLFLFVWAICAFCAKKVAAQVTFTWVGASGGNWTTASNWKIGGATTLLYPGSQNPAINNDIASIPNSSITINYGGNVTIGQLTTPNYGTTGLTINFTGAAPTLAITNGVSIAQPLSLGIGLTFSGTGAATISNSFSFGYQAGLAINSGSTVTLTSGVNASFNNPPAFTNNGTLNLNSATFPFTNTITNGGTINITGASGLLSNNGSAITSTGAISINAGSLTTSGNISSSGTFTETNGAHVTLNATNTFANTNIYTLNASTITLNNNNAALTNASGASVTVVNSTVNMAGAGAFTTNSGVITASGSTFSFGNNNYIRQFAGASFTTQSSCVFNLTTPGSDINNAGTWADHGSTYNLAGQNGFISNSGTGSTMQFRGTTVNITATNGNSQVINNASTMTIDSASVINAGSFASRVTNSGTLYAGTSNSSCVINLTAQSANVTNTGTFYLGSTSIIYPTAVSTQVNNNSGTFTIQSDQYGSGAIGPLNSTVGQLSSCSGTFNVERFFQGSTTYDNVKKRWLERSYRLISSPVNTGFKVSGNNVFGLNYIVGSTAGQTTAANSATNAFITGCAGGSTSAGNPSTYIYRESITPSNVSFISGDFLGITNITNSTSAGTITASDGNTYSLPVGTGVLFFFRGAATNWATRTSSPYIAPENVTLTSTGYINQQQIVAKDWYTPTSANLALTGSGTGGNFAVRGFNLTGNPYPCTIDWETVNSGGIVTTNINPTIYTFNPQTNQYDSYSSATHLGSTTTFLGKIVSGGGFFVQANNLNTAQTPTLTFNETAKAATSIPTGTSLYMGAPVAQSVKQLLRLKLIIDSLNYDNIAVIFNSAASPKYNPAEDSQYLPGVNAMESLSSLSDDSVRLSINSLPLPKLTKQVLKLNVKGTQTGLYTLKKTALEAIPKIYDIWLMDSYKKDSLDIRNNDTYAFNIDLADTNSFGANRFQLVVRQNPALGVHLLNFTAVKSSSGAETAWKTENEENYTNFTVERSTDNGATFTVIGGITSNALGTYSLPDKNPLNGTDEYRLKMEDLNGTITYSKIITLSFGNGGEVVSNINVYPNPSNGVINLAITTAGSSAVGLSNSLSGPQNANLMPGLTSGGGGAIISYDIKIVSITGSVIKTATSSTATWQDNVSSLAPGTYVIQVINNSDKSLVGKSAFVKL